MDLTYIRPTLDVIDPRAASVDVRVSDVQNDVRALKLLEDTALYSDQHDGEIAVVLHASGVSWAAYPHLLRVTPHGAQSYGAGVHFYISQPVTRPEGGW